MNKKAYKALEYYKIIDLLTDKASSPMGKDLCRKLTPSTDIEEIRSMQLQTHDASIITHFTFLCYGNHVK